MDAATKATAAANAGIVPLYLPNLFILSYLQKSGHHRFRPRMCVMHSRRRT